MSPEQQSHSEFEALEPRTKGSEDAEMVMRMRREKETFVVLFYVEST